MTLLDKLSLLRQKHLFALAAFRDANDCRTPSVLAIRATEQLVLDTGLVYARAFFEISEEERRKRS